MALRRNHRFALKLFLCSVGFVFVLWLILFLTILSEGSMEYRASYTVRPEITDNTYIQHEWVSIPPCVGIGKDCEVIPNSHVEQPVVNTVPEPSSLLLLVLPLILIWWSRNK